MEENGESSSKLSDREKSLLDDNLSLKAQLKELEATFNKMQADFTRSIKMRERLDSLCKVLQKQSQDIKDESAAQMGMAEGQGNKLAREVSDNMEMMEGVNKQLSEIMSESLKAKQENVDLTGHVSVLKQEYDDRHETMTNELQEASNALIKTKMELAHLRLKNAQDRETAYAEMHKLAQTQVENRQQMKDAKDLELELREKLTSYDEKFTALQTSLEATNNGYSTFTGEMDKVSKRTKDLDKETQEWQTKWEINNDELMGLTKNHERLQIEVGKVHENLIKMTNLYAQLEKERFQLMTKLGKEPPASVPLPPLDPPANPRPSHDPPVNPI